MRSSSASSSSGVGDVDAGSCATALSADVTARWIAFDSDRNSYNRDIYLVHPDGSQLTQLTTDPSTEMDPAFSNSGKYLAFVSDRSGTLQIYVMDLTTHAVAQRTTLAAGADLPSWSHDDQSIVFRSGASAYVMDAAGTNPRVVKTGPDTFNAYSYASFSLDDTQIICSRNNEIDAMKLDGTGFRNVVQNTTTTIETPSLSPDGVNVAFAAVRTSSFEQIAVAPFAGNTSAFTAQAVTIASAGSSRRPAWGPGNVIAFERALTTNGGWQISTAAISISTGPGAPACDVVVAPGDNRNPAWAPAAFQPK